MAAMRSKKREAGKPPEETSKNPSNIQNELTEIFQKNKQKKESTVKKGRALEPKEPATTTIEDEEELPFSEVQALPPVVRSRTAMNEIEKLLNLPNIAEEPSFKNKALLQSDERAKELIQETLKHTVCITTEDLLNVSEPMRQEFRRLLAKKRQSTKSTTTSAEGGPVPTNRRVTQIQMETIDADRLPEASYEVLTEDTNGMTKGSIIVGDPVVQYLNTMAPGEKPKSVVVAAESNALRTVYPLINGMGEVESLLDAGSQIVSMSQAVAKQLQVPWDPDITVHMESANKTLEKTLGLAKNVPFVLGTITVYLQVHIIAKVAYKVLLGRPFDTITESEIKNSKDGSQLLTITDPNTGERCVMDTHERGKPPSILMKPVKQDFVCNSMN